MEREGRDRVKAVQREAQVLVGTSGVEGCHPTSGACHHPQLQQCSKCHALPWDLQQQRQAIKKSTSQSRKPLMRYFHAEITENVKSLSLQAQVC